MYLHPLAVFAFSLVLSSCFKAPVTGMGVKQRSGVSLAITQLKAAETEGGGVAASFSSQSSTIQTMEANEGTAIQGSSASFQPGSLAIDTSIRMEESSSIANATLTSELGLATNITQSGTAVAVLPGIPTDAKQPFTLSIPLPVGLGLTTNELWTNLVVMYRVTIVAENKVVSGIIPRSDIVLKNGVASIETKYFGSFQTAVTSVAVTDKVQADTKATIITKSESAKLPSLSIVGRSPFVVAANGTIELNGINFRPTMIVAFGGNKVSGLKVASDSRASFIAPQGTAFGLTNVAVEQDGVAQTVSVFYAGSKTDFPIVMKPETEVCSGEKYYDAQGLLKTGSRLCKEPAVCAAEGQTSCMVSESFPAVSKASLASKLLVGQTVLGVVGTGSNRPADCSVDGGTDCVVTGTAYRAAKMSNFGAANISSGFTIAGIPGTNSGGTVLADCAADGATNCKAVAGFPAANFTGAAAKILSGETLAGVPGSAIGGGLSNCSTDGQTNCVAVTSYPSVDKSNIITNISKIRSTFSIAGQTGTLNNCSADGELGCVVLAPNYAAALTTGLNAKVLSGQSVAGVSGSVIGAPVDCSNDGGIGCVAVADYPAVDKVDLQNNLSKIPTFLTLGGLTGQQQDCSASMSFNCRATSSFQVANLTTLSPSNLREAITINNVTGTMPELLPPPPSSLTTTYASSTITLNWSDTGATGYLVVASTTGTPVTFAPARNVTYSTGSQGSDQILYVGSGLSFAHTGVSSGQSYHYAVYSYDVNKFYSFMPRKAAYTSLLCQGLAGGAWVAVPGDPTYPTKDFCVQKFEAKTDSSPNSIPAGSPWVSVTQAGAISACQTLGGNFDLISNPEWLTIGTNIAGVASNWSEGIVGNGEINRGHSDTSPSTPCPAAGDDTLAWVLSTCTSESLGGNIWNQKRTHRLSTGEVIWDLAGNVSEWTNYGMSNNSFKPYNSSDGSPVALWREFMTVNSDFSIIAREELTPTNAQKPFWNDTWASSTFGIGQYYSGTNGTGGALIRGGKWTDAASSGLFAANLSLGSGASNTFVGFRCVHRPYGP